MNFINCTSDIKYKEAPDLIINTNSPIIHENFFECYSYEVPFNWETWGWIIVIIIAFVIICIIMTAFLIVSAKNRKLTSHYEMSKAILNDFG